MITQNLRDDISVAITGLACRFPGDGNNLENFWDSICKGKSAWSKIPKDRFNADSFPANKAEGAHFLRQDISRFDANFFSISASEASAMDPQQRLMLEVTYEALEVAGLPLADLVGTKTGVFIGQFTDDYKDLVSRDTDTALPFSVTGLQRTSMSNRISWLLDLKGPSVTVDTACSSSLVALHLACQSLRNMECYTAIVGGCNLMINPEMFVFLSGQGFLASDGRCKTFDTSADGYGRGEGFAAVVLRRAYDAVDVGDPIRAVIRATGSGQDGHTKGFTLPSSEAQADLIRDVYGLAGLSFDETAYVEAHGTGTKAGDLEESTALSMTISANRPSGKELIVGSVKSNIGHLEAAAGLAGVIKSVLILENGIIPPNINLDTPNPKLLFDEWHIKSPTSLMPWPTKGVRRISSNSFGYGGSNAHAIIDDACSYLSRKGLRGVHFTQNQDVTNGPAKTHFIDSEPIYRLFPLSAQDKEGTGRVRKALASYLRAKVAKDGEITNLFLSDLAHTLSRRRSHLQWKSFTIASTPEELLQSLDGDGDLAPQYLSSRKPALGFVFSGQGAQWPAMGMELLQLPAFRESVQDADDYLRTQLGCEWSAVAELSKGKSTSKIAMALYGQTLCTVLQVALVDLLRTWNIKPVRIVGHSSGEIAAAYCLGALSREDAWRIAYYRGLLSSSLRESGVQGAMMAVGATPETITDTIASIAPGEVHVACINSPQSITVSGEVGGVDKLLEALQAEGIFARKLKVDTAYHSPHMQMVAEEYYEAISDISPQMLSFAEMDDCRMYSSVTGSVVKETSELGPAYWVRNLVSPVQFSPAVQNMAGRKAVEIDVMMEIGPHSALQGPTTQSLRAIGRTDVPYHSAITRGSSALDTALNLAGTLFSHGYPVNFDSINQTQVGARRPQPVVNLPSYPWNHAGSYWAESRLAKEYRLRQASTTGLLGAPYPSLVAQEKIWRGQIKLADMSWVADHKIQGTILYPAAGFIAMAVEAVLASHNNSTERVKMFRLREVNLIAALVVSPEVAVEYTVILRPSRTTPREGPGVWTEFTVSSSSDGKGLDRNCVGLIMIEFETAFTEQQPPPGPENHRHKASMALYKRALRDCTTAINPDAFYRQLDAVGLNYGPTFRCVTKIQTGPGQSCCDVDIPDVGQEQGIKERPHIIHPGTLDAVFHMAFAALKGSQGYINQAMVPKAIDEIVISANVAYEAGERLRGFSKASRYGFNEIIADIIMVDAESHPVLKVVGFCCSEVGAQSNDSKQTRSICSKLVWKPAIGLLPTFEDQNAVISKVVETREAGKRSPSIRSFLTELIQLVHHSKPTVSISEVVTAVSGSGKDPQSLVLASDIDISDVLQTAVYTIWCEDETAQKAVHDTIQDVDRKSVVSVQVRDLCHTQSIYAADKAPSDIIIVPDSALAALNSEGTDLLIKNAMKLLASDGRLCLAVPVLKIKDVETAGRQSGLTNWVSFNAGSEGGEEELALCIGSLPLSAAKATNGTDEHEIEEVFILQHVHPSKEALEVAEQLRQTLRGVYKPTVLDWAMNTPLPELKDKLCISLMELDAACLSDMSEEQFLCLKSLILDTSKLLWVSILASDDPGSSIIDGLARVVRNEEPGLMFHTLHLPKLKSKQSRFVPGEVAGLIMQVFKNGGDGGETEFMVRDGLVHTSRVVEDHVTNTEMLRLKRGHKTPTNNLSIEEAGPLKLTVEHAGLLGSLCYEPDEQAEHTPLAEDEVEITVKATSLNFRDVVTVMGQMPGLELGWDAAGIVRRVGSAVSDFNIGDRAVMLNPGALRTVHRAKESYCAPIDDDSLSFEAAASIPLVHGTAWYALICLARVQKGQSILIHAAAGGVGQSAIQIARHAGMEIFATVGSDSKRAFIRETYGILDDHIFSSRDLNFVQGIKQMTKARGVDVILNSLSGEALRQTWYCIAPFGTFIEIGARDIMGNTRLDMRPLMQNASFTFFDLKRIALERPDIMAEVIRGTFELQNKGITRPISPLVTYPASEIETAFRLMQSGRHQGKIAISFADDKQVVPVINDRRSAHHQHSLRLDPDAAYIIVGGFGGLGRSIATMLADSGARKLCILSRSGAAKSAQARSLVADLEQGRDVRVLALVCDVTDADAVEQSVKLCAEQLGPVRGVVQCAMVLRDALFRNMTFQDWAESTRPKVQGTWNLHRALETAGVDAAPVNFFVVLSSFTAIFGERGAANYAAGGAYQDAVAHFRRARGLPAVTLDVGIMRDIGVLAEQGMTQGFRDWEVPYGLDEEELLAMVKMAIAGDISGTIAPQVLTCLATGGSAVAAGIDTPWYLDDARFSIMARTGLSREGGGSEDSNTRIQARLAAAETTDAGAAIILEGIVDFVAKLLHTTAAEIDTYRFIHSYGIDSLVAIELVNWGMKECKARVTVFDIMAAIPITELAKKIAGNSALLQNKEG